MTKINYIQQINEFWRFYDENKSKLNTSDIVLYKVLLRYCNKIGWINPFTINPYLMAEINPLSQNTYYKSFKRLHDLKLIFWTKGKFNVSNQSVTILNIKFSLTDSLNTSIDNSIKFSLTDSLTNNNKTNIQLNNNTIKQLNKKDFDFLINSKEFKEYLKENKLLIQNADFIEKFNFRKSLLNLEIEKQIVEDWIKVRQTKKATNTETAFNSIKKQIELSGKTANECIKIAVEKSWAGIKADWINNLDSKINGNGKENIYKINPDIQNHPDRMKFT